MAIPQDFRFTKALRCVDYERQPTKAVIATLPSSGDVFQSDANGDVSTNSCL